MRDARLWLSVSVRAVLLAAVFVPFTLDAYDHDVAVDSILKPEKNYSVQGEPVPVQALYRNCGQESEFNLPVEVRMWDKNNVLVYANSGILDTLGRDPDTTSYEFAPWNSTAGKAFGEFKLEVWAKLDADQNDTNDVLSTCHYIVYNDNMAALDITSGWPKLGMPYVPRGTFMNQGAAVETDVEVTFKVRYGDGELYSSTRTITVLQPIEVLEVAFDTWTPPMWLAGHAATAHIETPGSDDNAIDDVLEWEWYWWSDPAIEELSQSTVPRGARRAILVSNPAGAPFVIGFELAARGPVDLSISSVDGRLVAILVRGCYPAGTHTVRWDGADRDGRRVGPGVYFVRLQAGEFRDCRKVVVVR